MKRSLLVNISVIVEVEETELTDDDEALQQVTARLIEAVEAVVPDGWESAREIVLDANVNCGRCAACDGWVTDRERPEPIDGLCNGAVHDGRLLCDEHLPPDHRWAF